MAKGDGRVTAKEMRRSCSGATQGPLRARRQGGAGVGAGAGSGSGAPRTVAIVLDEEGVSPRLLSLLGQVHEALAERGQCPGEAFRGEELEQVRPEDLGAVPWLVSGPRLAQGGSFEEPPPQARGAGKV